MNGSSKQFIVLRQLTSSDLGWFGAARDGQKLGSKQRAVNFNAAIVSIIFPDETIATGKTFLDARCTRDGVDDSRVRVLSKTQKNWRLGGKNASGEIFRRLRQGDLFICRINIKDNAPHPTLWTVVFGDEEEHRNITTNLDNLFSDRMLVLPADDKRAVALDALFNPMSRAQNSVTSRVASKPRGAQKLSVKDRLREPHIVQEMLRVAASLSSKAQSDFLDVLENVAGALRELLLAEGLIRAVELDHKRLWAEVEKRPVAFVDGGTANLASLGAEPIAIRVGSYVVTPGVVGPSRERFKIEKQLVDELFDTTGHSGLYEDLFEDVAKLRDVARISLETAGALECLAGSPKPHFLFVHGALVNPVSSYALDQFPNFTDDGIRKILPSTARVGSGKDANFVSTYLQQLQALRAAEANICGVVERASGSRIVTEQLIEKLKTAESSPGGSTLDQAWRRIVEYRISDAVLFHCILNEGEYLEPIQIDRNDLRRAPNNWKDVIKQYPKPLITYLGVSEISLPLRLEFFAEPPDGYTLVVRLLFHSCRLMPNYAFPAGLDIVDKFAKVPQWMAKPITSMMATQLLRKAMKTGDPKIIAEARRLLSGNAREWYLRPNFNK